MTKFAISQGMMNGIEWRVQIKIYRIRFCIHRLHECVKAGNKTGWSGVFSEKMPRIISLCLKIIKIVMNNKLENFGKVIK